MPGAGDDPSGLDAVEGRTEVLPFCVASERERGIEENKKYGRRVIFLRRRSFFGE